MNCFTFLSATSAAVILACTGTECVAQVRAPASITGRVIDDEIGRPLEGARIFLEGTELSALSDAAGRFLLLKVPPGPQILRAEYIGRAPFRVSLTVPVSGVLTHEVRLSASALNLPGLIVAADPLGRARGELGTATVIESEAIRHQTATSLAGILELVPGVVMQPPGLDNVQQFALRSVPTSGIGAESLGASASGLASAGTLIVLDGVPLSNNANLQSLGPRGEQSLQTAAGGGIDLRRIPATLIERVEVIRGIPSARYGDLSQGAVVVDTRAGAVPVDISARQDRQTTEAGVSGGRVLGEGHTGTVLFNIGRTLLSPGRFDDEAYRAVAQVAHRLRIGDASDDLLLARFTLDTRIDYYQMLQDTPENETEPGRFSRNRDSGIRIGERARLRLDRGPVLELTAAVDRQRQRSSHQRLLSRPAVPFTDRLTEGRSTGRFIGGAYEARVDVDGYPWLLFGRLEALDRAAWLGFAHQVRAGLEVRREWNSGPGVQFDIEFPPQVSFNGVQGFDRPRRYDDVPAMALSSYYLDDRLSRTLPGDMHLMVQGGLRLDVLHTGTTWFSGSRHSVLQPRLNIQLAPRPWLRLRAGGGRTAKAPTIAQLSPAAQYHDVVNVNWYTNDPVERLAVLTTSILDAVNPDLRQTVTDKVEAGFEVGLGSRGAALAVVIFADAMDGAIGFERRAEFLLRDHFQLSDSTTGTGVAPQIMEPATHSDTIPVLLLMPSNSLVLETRGVELTLTLPEISRLNTSLEVQGAWIRSELGSAGLEVGSYFSDFQLDPARDRTPYWEGSTQTGDRALLNYRLTHRQPSAGLVITATIQHIVRERSRNLAATDSLSFAGYITRTGDVVHVPDHERQQPEYQDLQLPRRTILTDEFRTPADWMLSMQVSKTLPLDGRLSFYAFNALDRVGRFAERGLRQRVYPSLRFGLELTVKPAGLFR